MMLFQVSIDPLMRHRREILEILTRLVGPTSAQPGCLGCELYEEVGDDRRILYMELWDSEPAVRRHVQSANYAKVLAALDLSRTRPKIHFYDVSRVDGIELIESWRGQSASQT